MNCQTIMNRQSSDRFIVFGLVMLIIFCSIPFKQQIEVIKNVEYTSTDQFHVEVGFGGPRITWTTVMCNRTVEIRFIHQTGVWISTQNVVLASFRSTAASYNFKADHSTYIIEITADGPFFGHISYTCLVEIETNVINGVLYLFRQ